jgi:UDP-N-acetylmuramoylalanine--D-glutamate ligase
MSNFKQKLKFFKEKKVAILGLGIENYALVQFLLKQKVDCMITICDQKNKGMLGEKHIGLRNRKNIAWKSGKNSQKNLDGFDFLFRSPGWPLFDPEIEKAVKMGVKLISPIRLFFNLCPSKNIIGITGTKGKGTTASLIYEILKLAGKRVWLGGNIGIAPFAFIEKIRKSDWVLLELSSFQLEDMTVSPFIAVMVNFYKEHLISADPDNPNHHQSMRGYWRAKLNIVKWQKRGNIAAVNKKLLSRIKKYNFKGKIIYFTKSDLKTKLAGEHNKENIAAAIEVAKILRVKSEIAKEAIRKFKGLEHRLEFVKKVRGVSYYDDSFATTPEAAITAIKSFTDPIIFLAGGAEKNSDFKELARVVKKRIKFAILFKGDATPRLKRELLKAGMASSRIKVVNSMREAIKKAQKKSKEKDIVLLSPACASFGMFKNYKERGRLFKKEVKRLK